MSAGASRARVYAALGVVYVVWGSTYLGIDVAIGSIPPFLMAAIRFAIAGALLFAWTVRRGGARITWRHWLAAAPAAIPMLVIGNASVGLAQQEIDTGTASLIIASVPLWLALLDRVFVGQRLTTIAVCGLVLGFGGVALLAGPAGGFEPYALLLVFTSLAWSVGSLYARHVNLQVPPMTGAAMQMLVAAVVLVPVGAVAGEFSELQVPTWEGVAAMGYLVVFGSLLAFTSYVWLLRVASTSLVGTYAYVNPIVAVALGALFLDEAITWQTIVGGGVVVAAVALIVSAPATRARTVDRRPSALPARAR